MKAIIIGLKEKQFRFAPICAMIGTANEIKNFIKSNYSLVHDKRTGTLAIFDIKCQTPTFIVNTPRYELSVSF